MTEKSVFDGTDPAANPANADPAKPAAPAVPDELQGLVGEGKKYASIEDAMKSIPHKEMHIGKLETDNAALRAQMEELSEKLDKAKKVDDILNRMDQTPSKSEKDTPNSTLDADAVANVVLNKLKEDEVKTAENNNINTVDSVMKEKFGTEKAQEMVKKKATELGVGVDFLMATAAKSPKAFFLQMGIEHTPTPQSFNPSSTTNTENLNPNIIEVGTYAYYEKIRKSDPAKYNSRETQTEMFQSLQKLGREKFYKS